MTKRITVNSSLYFYDGIQVFDAVDAIGGNYLGLLVEELSDSKGRYLVVGISSEDIRNFRLGQLDLRSLIVKWAEPDWFTVEGLAACADALALIPQTGSIPDDYLPSPGFVLQDATTVSRADVVQQEALARHSVVMGLTLDPPESARGHVIRARKLGGLLLHVQSLLINAYARSIKDWTASQRSAVDRDLAPLLNVAVPALPGSFRLILVPASAPDLFGGGDITKALEVVDEITSVSADPDETLVRVKKYRGHTASAYLHLLRFIAESDVSMKYAWAAPNRVGISERSITRSQAEALISILSASESIGTEQVVLIGHLRKVDLDAGTWRISVVEDNKDYSGKVRPGVSLSHLETDHKYKFVCDEEAEEVTGTGRETKTLYLTSVSEAM